MNKQVKRAQVELQSDALLAHARNAIRRGQKLAIVTKLAADPETIAYWSEYFGAYGTLFVRPVSLKKLARAAEKQAWGAEDEEWYQKELEKSKQEEEAKGKTSALSPEQLEAVVEVVQALDVKSEVKNAQVMYDVAVRVEAAPDVALLPDAFEHTFKFALGAVKPSGAAHLSVDHVFVEIDGESMVAQAVCGVSLTSGDLNAFVSTLKSQLEKYLKDADFSSSVQVEEPMKRVARGCIIEQAMSGAPLVRLASQFGRGPARIARRCAERQMAGVAFSPVGRAQAKFAQAMIESAEALSFQGDASSEQGALADCGEGIHAQIKYQGTALPKGFQWILAQGDEVLDQGESEVFEEARGDIQSALPEVRSKAQAAKAALKRAMTEALGPVASFEKLASVGQSSEYKVETKAGRTAWVTVEGGKVVNKVGEL